MLKRSLDVLCALVGLVLLWPLILAAAIGIKLSSPGPVLFRARRAGRHGVPFTMFKLRTMHVPRSGPGPRITASSDPRVFPWGALLRHTKVDELPQLINILRGEMSVIGPRPEDPYFVSTAYSVAQRGTLLVRPGLSSPGSLYHDALSAQVLDSADPDDIYRRHLLPVKLALDLEYVRRASLAYDLRLIARTVWQVTGRLLGRNVFPSPPELALVSVRPRWTPPPHSPRATRATVSALVLAVLVGGTCTDRLDGPAPQWLYDSSEVILVGAGDIGVCGVDAVEATAALLDDIPGTVFTAGDNAYPSGTAQQFEDCYGPSWGRHRARTRPAPGNHDYQTAGAAGYFAYFGARAGPTGDGYYSYELGDWHVISLNSEVAIDAGSAQFQWLVADLAASDAGCTVAYWHRPRFNSGAEHGNEEGVSAAWEALYAAGADVVVAGHEHVYERFGPQDPAAAADPDYGIRQFVVGTGGADDYAFATPQPNSEVRATGTPGVLALRLLPDSYEWRFVGVAGSTFTDAGTTDCHGPPPSPLRSLP